MLSTRRAPFKSLSWLDSESIWRYLYPEAAVEVCQAVHGGGVDLTEAAEVVGEDGHHLRLAPHRGELRVHEEPVQAPGQRLLTDFVRGVHRGEEAEVGVPGHRPDPVRVQKKDGLAFEDLLEALEHVVGRQVDFVQQKPLARLERLPENPLREVEHGLSAGQLGLVREEPLRLLQQRRPKGVCPEEFARGAHSEQRLEHHFGDRRVVF